MDYKDLFLHDIPDNPEIEKVWSTRPKSKLVRYMMWVTQTPRTSCENRLGVSHQYFDNKLQRNSWSFEDIITIADECGLQFGIDRRLFIFLAKDSSTTDSKVYDYGYADGYEQAKKDILYSITSLGKKGGNYASTD